MSTGPAGLASLPRKGLPGLEGAFLPSSFRLVQALATTGRAQEAAELFEQLLALASPAGLYGEEMGNQPTCTSRGAKF